MRTSTTSSGSTSSRCSPHLRLSLQYQRRQCLFLWPRTRSVGHGGPGLTLDLSGTYNTAVINDPTTLPSPRESPRNPRSQRAEVHGNAAVNYQYRSPDQLNGLLNVSVSMVGPERDQAAYPQILPPYNLVDARAGVSSGPWGAYLFGTNLTNREAGADHQQHHIRLDRPTPSRGSRPISRAPSVWISSTSSRWRRRRRSRGVADPCM